MTTEAQIEANRANAQKSTGPRSPEGKAKVAQNALKHGLLAKQAVVVGEDTDDFDLLRDQLYAEWAPVGPTEARLVERLAGLFWRLQRAERFGTESFDVMYQQRADDPQIRQWRPRLRPEAADPVVGLTVVKDFSETRVLERLLVCERRLENSLYRTMAELRQVQGQRQGAAEGARGDSRSRRSREGQDRGGPFHRVPQTRPPDFTLADLLAKIGAQEDEPAGATTNTPAAEEQSCDNASLPGVVPATKPISEEGVGCVSRTTPPAQSETCETKPIGVGPGEGQSLGGTGVRSNPAPDAAGETKPISGPAGRDERPLCETNPILPSGTGILPVNEDHRQDADATIPPDGVTTNLPEAQGQACETKPIGQSHSCETKPISAGAKRERFGYTPIFRRRR